MRRFHLIPALVLLMMPTIALVGCGGGANDQPPIGVQSGEPLRIGDDSPLDDLDPDAN